MKSIFEPAVIVATAAPSGEGEWPGWLTARETMALDLLESAADMACHWSQTDRVRAAGRRVRSDLSTIRLAASKIALTSEIPWSPVASPNAVEALQTIEAVAAVGAVATFAAPGPWGTALGAIRQLRQDLCELEAALDAASIAADMLEEVKP
jgi:hypothetical protein